MYKHPLNLALAGVGVIAFLIGLSGFEMCNYYSYSCKQDGQLETIFDTILLVRGAGDYTLATAPWPLVVAHYLMPTVTLVAILAFFFGGIWRDLWVLFARVKHRHTIICGLGATGMHIVDHLLRPGPGAVRLSWPIRHFAPGVVAVDSNPENIHAATCERRHVPVLAGDATRNDVLKNAGLLGAEAAIICTGDDATNIDVALRIKDLTAGERHFLQSKLRLLVELRSDWFFRKLVDENRRNSGSDTVDLRFFNSYDIAARLLLRNLAPPPHPRLDGGSFVVIGFGAMGHEIALSLLRSPSAPLGGRPRVIVLDREAEAARRNFLNAYPAAEVLGDLCFCEADFQPGAASSGALAAALGDRPIQAVFVCLPDDATNLHVGFELRRFLDISGHLRPRIHIRLWGHQGLGGFLAELESLAVDDRRLSTFGAVEDLLDPEILFAEKLDRLAISCHQQYLSTQPVSRAPEPADYPWPKLAEHFKSSNRRMADHIRLMLGEIGLIVAESASLSPLALTAEEIETLAQFEHRRWSAELMLNGWTHGTVRDDAQRKHTCLLGWEMLPESVREQNRRHIGGLPAILARTGCEIRRPLRIELFSAATADLPLLEKMAAAEARDSGLIVLADIGRPEARALASRLSRVPGVSLWLVEPEAPQKLLHKHPEDAEQITALLRLANGWARPPDLVRTEVSAAAA